MRISREDRLKNLFTTKQVIEEEIQKDTNKLVFSQEIFIHWEKPNYNDVLGLLQDFLSRISFRWVDLEISFFLKAKKSMIDSPGIKTQVFVFGNRRFILKNIKEVTGRIIHGKIWITKEIGISPEKKFSIKDFIRPGIFKL